MPLPYSGAPVSQHFRERWMSGKHIGDAAPVGLVQVRKGHLGRKWRTYEEVAEMFGTPVFGDYHGSRAHGFWFPDWHADSAWKTLDAVNNIRLEQSFANNGITTCTIQMDNEALVPTTGFGGALYHAVEQGYYSPLRGYVGQGRPDPSIKKTPFFNFLPNAQIRVQQGYGEDTMLTTFLGLIDDIETASRPDGITITSRDFGGVLVDEHFFGWAKEMLVPAPTTFAPRKIAEKNRKGAASGNWIIIDDVADIVKTLLRWCGFKSWEVESTGVNLQESYVADTSQTFMDVINVVKDMVGYTFFIAEPLDPENDLDIGRPIFRNNRVFENHTGPTEFIDDKLLLTDAKVRVSNQDDRCIIRCRGAAKNDGATVDGDQVKRIMYAYIPPWAGQVATKVAGVIKQLTHTDELFTKLSDCEFGCYLIALQIALGKYTAIIDLPANPGMGLDTLQALIDRVQGLNSRFYVTNRTQEMAFGSNGYWTMEIGAALVDTPEADGVMKDFNAAIKILDRHEKNPWIRKRDVGYQTV